MTDLIKPLFYEFDEFRVDTERRLLSRVGEPISLTPKVFDTLLVFLENRGEVLTKDRLIGELWPDSFVEEANIAQNVAVLRKALGERSKENRFIVTIPGRGYRFVAEVVTKNRKDKERLLESRAEKKAVVSTDYSAAVATVRHSDQYRQLFRSLSRSQDQDDPAEFITSPPLDASVVKLKAGAAEGLRSMKLLAAFVAGAVVISAVIVAWYFIQSSRTTTQIESIAVMPFVNETGDPQVEYLSDGMTDTLIGSLSELPNIKVKARTSVFRYKGKEIDPKAVGKELGVQAIVNGRVTQRDGRTEIRLEVVDTETEDVILSKKYDKSQSEIVTLQSDIARDVSGKLKSKLSGAEEAKVMKAHTADPEALQLYLQGQFYRHKGGRSNVLRATDYYNRAIEKDPNYALAYAGLALNYNFYMLYNLASPVEYGPKANAAAMRALELDDSLPEAHVALGESGGDAEQEFRRAIELNPNYADAHDALCNFLTMKKRFDEAITEGKKAQELDPLSAIVTADLGTAYAFARRPDEAIEILTRAHEMDPTLIVPLGYLGFAQTLKGQYTEAIATFRKAIEVSDGSPNAKGHLAYALAKAGQRDEALKMIEELKHLAEHQHINSFHFAVPYIALGDKNEAFFWLGKGIDEGSIGFDELNVHPWFDDLRSDPRFEALLKRTNPNMALKP